MKQIFAGIVFLVSLHSQATVWEVKNTWNDNYEKKFSEWVKSSAVHLEMALQPRKKYYQQNLDCADLVYYLRAIFSYENNLDFLAYDKDRKPWGPQMHRYDNIIDIESRVQAFIKDLLVQTNTTTLQLDSALVGVNRDEIRAGVILLTDKSDSNHAWIVKDVYASGVPQLISATVTTPSTPMIYPSQTFPYGPSVFRSTKSFLNSSRGGFRRFLWPQEIINRQIIKSSLEQTQIPIVSFFDKIQNRLAIQAESESERVNRLLDEICVQMRIRTNLVTDAIWFQKSAAKWTSANIDALSTDNRDQKIKDLIMTVKTVSQSVSSSLNDAVKRKTYDFIYAQAGYTAADTEKRCLVQWAKDKVEPLSVLVQRFSKMQTDPKTTLEQRWGLYRINEDEAF